MNKNYRVHIPAQDARNGNIGCLYAADDAAWIWHPAMDNMVEFELEWQQENAAETVFFISADNRFELFLDEEYIAMGPDRCDVAHWAFSALKLPLTPGIHRFRARCWHYPYESGIMPLAQFTCRPGFLFGAEDEKLRPQFNTGRAPWKVRTRKGVTFEPVLRWIGSATITDLTEYSQVSRWEQPVVIDDVRNGTLYGAIENLRRLYPTELPEQLRSQWQKKLRLRTVWNYTESDNILIPAEKVTPEWQDFFEKGTPVTVPPHSQLAVIADFEDYLCAYPEITVAGGGAESSIELCWAESFYDNPGDEWSKDEKPHRNTISGKYFVKAKNPQRDTFCNFPEKDICHTPFWWRAGRYILLKIRTGNEAATLKRLRFFECRYPTADDSEIAFDRHALENIQPMMRRVMQSCMHETFMDCPYFEQLMYVGDCRTECLTAYIMMRDAALPKRALHLLDWSRAQWGGLVSERYPSAIPQLSSTFSSLWPLMVRDFMLYRRFESEQEFRQLRSSVRSMHIALAEYVSERDLLENLPGWSFVDWCIEWDTGVPAENSMSCSSVFSLHYLLSLRAAIELEEFLPERNGGLKSWYQDMYDRVAASLLKHFWSEEEALFSDDFERKHFSIHAQSLAILSGLISGERAERCFAATFTKENIAMPTLYFIFYLFETFKKMGCAEKILSYSFIWEDMLAKGAVTTWETPEPTRSDCHAWGAHLYYHYFASIAGIRPAAPGFRKVIMEPTFGELEHIYGIMPHPDGSIEFDLRKNQDGTVSGKVILPSQISGDFLWNGETKTLVPGKNLL